MNLSLPTRYMHSHRLVIQRKDEVQIVEAIAQFCRRVNLNKLEEMNNFIM